MNNEFLRKLRFRILRLLPGFITCAEADRCIDDYLDDRLPAERRRLFDWHMRICGPCQRYLRAYSKTVALTAATGSAEAAGPSLPETRIKSILAARASDHDRA